MFKIAAIVLAAGASTRFGDTPKQLADWHGETLVHRAVRVALGWRQGAPDSLGFDRVVVVVGHEAGRVEASLADLTTDARLVVEHNASYAGGQSTSIRAGLRAARREEPALDAALFLPCDQPGIDDQVVGAVVGAWIDLDERASIDAVVPLYRGPSGPRRGAPVLWSAARFADLERLDGDAGGRTLLAARPERVREVQVETDDPSAGEDIDTIDDYRRLHAARAPVRPAR